MILRRREICTSIERSNTSYSRPRASSISLSRDSGWRGCCTSTLSTENSPVVSGTVLAVAGQRARGEVELELAEAVNVSVSARGRARRPGGRLAAQHRVDARHQLARVEGLGQVVVGAHLQADDAVDVVALGGEHDDRGRGRLRAQAAADRQAVLARQHQVEHHQVVALARQLLVHARGVGHRA